MEVRTRAPGKIILAGEHAVVHGSMAVAASIDLYTYVSLHFPTDSGSFSGTSGQGRRSDSKRYNNSDGNFTERAAACKTPFSAESAAASETTLCFEEYLQTFSRKRRCQILSNFYQECMRSCRGSDEICAFYKKFMSDCPDATKGDGKLTERAAARRTPFSAESATACKTTSSFEEDLQKLSLKRRCWILSNFYQRCMKNCQGSNEICEFFKKFMSDCPDATKGYNFPPFF